MLKGALHIHSTYSDGEFTVAELRRELMAAGCRFACITDHADWFDADSLAAYVAECDARSDEQFRFVPGLEFSCVNRMHVLGYGVTTLVDSVDPQAVIRHIEAHGGVAVIAHPKDAAFDWIESFDVLPRGIEVWNSKYDGRYAPRPGTFALLGRLQARRSDMRAFYGQDLHWRRQYRGLYTMVDADALEPHAILTALAEGRYSGVKADLTLPASGDVAPELMASFARTHARSRHMREWIGRAKRWADGLGMPVPAPVKSRLRRIF
jgi:hypothetical protein